MFDKQLLRGSPKDLDEAIKLLYSKSGPINEAGFKSYKKMVTKLLSRTIDEEGPGHTSMVSMLKDTIYKLTNQFKAQSSDKKINNEMLEMLMALHYQNIMFIAKSAGLKDLAAKCAITVLKYPDYIPQDKAFYQAGMACKEQNNTNLAFLLFNRFLQAICSLYLYHCFYTSGYL